MTNNLKFEFQNKIKIFADGADKTAMLSLYKNPAIHGLTTNPSLMRQAGVTDYVAFCKDILQTIKTKPVSFEVFADDFDEMYKQGKQIATWGSNVYVKIPITNSKGESSQELIATLAKENVHLNITAIFTMDQVEQTCESLKNGPASVVSIFAGRIADAGYDPAYLMADSVKVCRKANPKIELLWASTREAFNIVQAELCGCDIITASPDIIKKMSNFKKDLKTFSLETVQMFKSDAEKSGYKI